MLHNCTRITNSQFTSLDDSKAAVEQNAFFSYLLKRREIYYHQLRIKKNNIKCIARVFQQKRGRNLLKAKLLENNLYFCFSSYEKKLEGK